jgi:hypothetical protein
VKPEAKVKKKVKATLDKLKAYYFMPFMAGYGTAGVPDIVVCYKGRFIGIECKAGDNKPTPLQKKALRDIELAGGISMWVTEKNVETVHNMLLNIAYT